MFDEVFKKLTKPKVFKVPIRLNILERELEFVVYDPVTSAHLISAVNKAFAEEYALGFLAALKSYADHGCLSIDRWADDTDQYFSYLLGIQQAQELCEQHIRNGGVFELGE